MNMSPTGVKMAEGGSSPLGDPGGLHVYSMNGGSHKLAELVAEGSPEDMLGSASNTPGPMSSPYGNMQTTFTYPNPVGFDSGNYEEVKRSSTLQSSYYSPMDPPTYMNSHSNIYDMSVQGYSAGLDLYKSNMETAVYSDMMSPKPNTISPGMTIKKEKLDYNDIGLMNSHSPDIPYGHNSSMAADWNYYNAMHSSSSLSNMDQSHYSSYSQPLLQNQQQYQTNQFYNTTHTQAHDMPVPLGLTNEDIHQQSKKITQSIINSEWTGEPMYKQQMYHGASEESYNKKRRAITEKKGRDSKSRKKKSNDISGHSKAVANILLSDKKSSASLSKNKNDEDVLDSGERNNLVTALMNNLRSTVQFESFCLSLPRSPTKESAFHNKVRCTSDLIGALGLKAILSKPFPPNYIQQAEKVISSFTKALNNTEMICINSQTSGKYNVNKEKHLSFNQVEEHIPHSMVWVVKVGETTLCATWEGQFVVTVNPVQNTLACSIFQFSPCFSFEGVQCLQQCRLTKQLAVDIKENMEQFEVSRQLRFDVSLDSVIKLYLYSEHERSSEGCLVLKVFEAPAYFQRWLHTSAEDKNQWKPRGSFFQGHCGGSTGYEFLYIGGLMSELNEVVALVLASNPQLRDVYDIGVTSPLQFRPGEHHNNTANRNNRNGQNTGLKHKGSSDGKVSEIKRELDQQIMNVLEKHGIAVEYVVEQERAGKDNVIDEIIFEGKVSRCFKDFINHTCKSATELDDILHRKVYPSLYGFYDSDFDLTLVPGGDVEQLTIGELISTKCSDVVYFSFCRKEVGQLGHDFHCSQCKKCFTHRYQHCPACNRCSDIKTICEYCGCLRTDQTQVIIKPQSVFKMELQTGRLDMNSVKEEWVSALNQPDNDILVLQPNYSGNTPSDFYTHMEYNSNNAMVDQLGLLNPVGFLLGQGAAGATRKHRRYKSIQSCRNLGSITTKEDNSTSGCILQ